LVINIYIITAALHVSLFKQRKAIRHRLLVSIYASYQGGVLG